MNNSKYVPICSILQDIDVQYMQELEFDLSRSWKVKVDDAITNSTYDLLLVNNSKYMPACSISWDVATQNMHDLEFDLHCHS